MNKPGKPSFFKASLLAALMTTALGTQAAGLGKLTVFSAIGQPLRAEVALTATAEELSSLSVKLAAPDAFREAGIEFVPVLAGLNMSIVSLDKGKPMLKLTTERPVNEPFLHFLVELNWTAGRMVREYTFLLDPPEMLQVAKAASRVSPVVPAATPLPMSQPVPAKSSSQAAPSRVTEPVSGKAPVGSASGAEYQVVRGDTLSRIARENRPESVSLDQMLVALFNSNRDAFVGDNMNRLRAGKILRLPDADEVAKVDAGAARKLIIGQNAEFNAYRRRLAEAAGAAPVADEAPTQQASGAIKPRVEEKAPPVAAKDKLEVSRTETAKSAAKAVGGSNLEEDLIARDKALREASERIVDLEKNIENLKHLVELKSQTGAKLQQEAQTAPAQAPQPAEAKPAAPSAEPAPPPAATVPAKPEEPAPAAVEPPPAPAAAKPEVKKPAAPPPPPPEPDFIAENPELVYGGGALAALLLGYFGYAARRKKKTSGDEEWQNELVVATPKAGAEPAPSAAVFGAASESVDSGEVSIQGDFSDIGMLTTEEKVDPVAEADVLMAYGRDRQAEEILLEGLRQDSGRAAIHMKLLELYAKQENIAEFETIANELHKLNGGRGADWERTQAMALKLGLAGGLFLGAKSAMADMQEQEASDAYPAVSTPDQPAGAETLDAGTTSPEAEQPGDEDTGALDFDLDLGTTDGGPAAAVDAAPAVAAPAPEEAMSLDFDFDLGTPESAAPQAPEASSQASANVVEDDGSIDFALDLGSDANATAEASAEPVKSAATELEFDLDLGSVETPDAIEAPEVAAFAREVSSSAAPAELPAVPAHESAGAEAPDDLQIDFDLELDAAPAPAAATPASLDLADISLDLDDVEPVAPGAGQGQSDVLEMALEEVASADVVATTGSDRTSSEEGYVEVAPAMQPDNPEVTTKLELAQAYEEMGDQEGARDLLNEVLNEGSAAQQAEARLRLDQLGI